MKPLRELAAMNANIETNTRANEFAHLAKFILAHDGKLSKSAIAAQASSRSDNLGPKLADIVKSGAAGGIGREYFKTAQTAGTLTGGAFADYSVIANGFVSSLVNVSAYDTMLAGGMLLVPLRTGTVGAINVSAQAFSVSEGSAKAISRISVTGQQINPSKAHAIVVMTQELARAPGANAIALIGRELRQAVSITTDTQFIATLISGLSVATSTGSTAESVRADIENLLRLITTGQSSKLFILTTALICKAWSMLTDSKGLSAFPDLGPLGGFINQIPVLVSDGVTTGNVVLADASGIAAASGDVVLQEFHEGSLQFDTAPDSPVSATTAYVSLWQQNLVGLVVERFYVAARLRSDAVAVVNNSGSYGSGNSPP